MLLEHGSRGTISHDGRSTESNTLPVLSREQVVPPVARKLVTGATSWLSVAHRLLPLGHGATGGHRREEENEERGTDSEPEHRNKAAVIGGCPVVCGSFIEHWSEIRR